jgi:CheY-like chemotaxis protein
MAKRIFWDLALQAIFSFRIKRHNNPSANEIKRVSGKRILLAESSIIGAVYFESVLRGWNFKMDLVQNGEEAIQYVNTRHYDILFMDIQMPEMGGLKAAREIRQMGHNMIDLPILVIARHAVSIEELKFYGVNGVILKPFSKEELESKIGQFISNNDR